MMYAWLQKNFQKYLSPDPSPKERGVLSFMSNHMGQNCITPNRHRHSRDMAELRSPAISFHFIINLDEIQLKTVYSSSRLAPASLREFIFNLYSTHKVFREQRYEAGQHNHCQ